MRAFRARSSPSSRSARRLTSSFGSRITRYERSPGGSTPAGEATPYGYRSTSRARCSSTPRGTGCACREFARSFPRVSRRHVVDEDLPDDADAAPVEPVLVHDHVARDQSFAAIVEQVNPRGRISADQEARAREGRPLGDAFEVAGVGDTAPIAKEAIVGRMIRDASTVSAWV